MNNAGKRMALYIDADNVSEKWLPAIFEQLEPSWNLHLRRAYGVNLRSLQRPMQIHGVLPIEVLPNTSGKNATDHALIIDVMKELYSGIADAFCLVSGDGDFTRLAQILREAGKTVFGFGPNHTPVCLRNACTSFNELGDDRSFSHQEIAKELDRGPQDTPGVQHIVKVFREIVEELNSNGSASTVGRLSAAARRRDPGFSPKLYNSKSLTRLLRKLAVFDLLPIKDINGETLDYRVNMRENGTEGVHWVQ
jgi:hypothetical protein